MTTAEKRKLERELAALPSGAIVRRTIRGAERFYHQWREDGATRSRYLKADEVEALRALIERRKELKRILRGERAGGSPIRRRFMTDVATGRDLLDIARGVERFEKRDMFPSVMKYLRSDTTDRVLVISGLRRTGKTTMLRQAILSLSAAERSKAAYAKMSERDTMAALKADLKTLHDAGFRYVFIDEVTLMEDFIDTASVLSDIFAGMGMKIYIRFGGTLRAGEILFSHRDAKNDSASFRNNETTRFYIDTAIARNIQRSLRCVDGGRHFRLLIDLYEADELTNAINRIIEDMNHRFVLQTLLREFRSSDLRLASRNLAKSADPKRQTDALLKADIPRVTRRLMDILDIRRAEDLKVGLTDGTAAQIREYLQALDLVTPCPVEFDGAGGERSERMLFSQPGMRFCQAQALVFALMNDESLSRIPADERKIVRDAILDEVRGRMLEDIVLLETIKAKANGPVSVFKLQFAAGEYDMVVADSDTLTCDLYEVKHSTEPDERQRRHLTDEKKLAATGKRYGAITSRTVLYRGPDFTHESGVAYRNVASYLKSL